MKGYRPAMSAASATLAFVLLMTACALPTPGVSEPQVRIAAPLQGSTILLGDTIAIRAIVDDDRGIAWVQLWADDQPAGNIVTPTAPVTQFTQDLLWTPNAAGWHAIKVIAHNNAGDQVESEAITLYVSADASLRATTIAVQLATATPNPFAAPSPIYTFTPVPSATPTATPTATLTPATPAPCYDGAAYVADVTVPDGSQFDKGTAFSKGWRLRNTGTCTWDKRYQFVFVGGVQLEGPSPVALPQAVSPGGTVDVTVPMVAPDAMGTYRSQWQMRNPDGLNFGSIVYVLIEVRPGPGDPPIVARFEVFPNIIRQGEYATIYWEYINGTFARLTPGGEGGVGSTGSLVVSPNTTTDYRLVVSNGAGTVERTTRLVVQPAPPPTPVSPANLAITATRTDGFDFTWTDNSPDEQGFRLYNADTQQILATFAPNVASGVVSGLACETSYRFYLVAFNQGGESWSSNTVQATTGTCGG